MQHQVKRYGYICIEFVKLCLYCCWVRITSILLMEIVTALGDGQLLLVLLFTDAIGIFHNFINIFWQIIQTIVDSLPQNFFFESLFSTNKSTKT